MNLSTNNHAYLSILVSVHYKKFDTWRKLVDNKIFHKIIYYPSTNFVDT